MTTNDNDQKGKWRTKQKTYLQRPNVTTYLQKLHMFMGKEHTYIYAWKNRKLKLGTGAKGELDNVSAKRENGTWANRSFIGKA